MGPVDTYSHSTRGNSNRRAGGEERRNGPIAGLVSHRQALWGVIPGFQHVKAASIRLTTPQGKKIINATSFFRSTSHYLGRISQDLGTNLVRSHSNIMRSQSKLCELSSTSHEISSKSQEILVQIS